MILLIDNYDSFVHNLARHFRRLGQETTVARNDQIDADGVRSLAPDAIVLSPGPCAPGQAGNALQIVRNLHTEIPMLGVCLGHQVVAEALGGRIVRASRPVHGQTSNIIHTAESLFSGLPSPMAVCRYHSLVVEAASLPVDLRATAWSDDGVLMAFEHCALPICGVQFHPEAILTQHGYALLVNFLKIARIDTLASFGSLWESEYVEADEKYVAPAGPITF